jgi:predicted ATP-grasp superfamily ATP-dependent carboligase
VRTFEDVPEVMEACSKFVAEIGFTGFFGMDYMRDEESGDTYLIECNARPTAQSHVAEAAGVDLCEALFDAMNGRPIKPYSVKEGFVITLYPQEIVRNPNSEFIHNSYHDVPDDDPDLVAAYEDYVRNARQDQANPVRIQSPDEDSRVRSGKLVGHRPNAQVAP